MIITYIHLGQIISHGVAYDEITLKTSGGLQLSEVSSFASPAFVQQNWLHLEPSDNGLYIRQ